MMDFTKRYIRKIALAMAVLMVFGLVSEMSVKPAYANSATFTLSVVSVNATGAYVTPSTVTSATAITLFAGTRAGYTFSGWSVSPAAIQISGPFNALNARNTGFTVNHTTSTAIIFTANWIVTPPDPPPPPPPSEDFFELSLRAGPGGLVALENSSFGTIHTRLRMRAGDRVTIHARPNHDYYFDRWTFRYGDVLNIRNETTTFIMPNRDVQVWADFEHYRDRHFRDRDRYWIDPHAPFPNVPEGPVMPPPAEYRPMTYIPELPTAPLDADEPDLTGVFTPVMTPVNLTINGFPHHISRQPAVTRGATTYIPVGELFRALGYSVEWNGAARQATLRRNLRGNDIVMVITEGSSTFTINGVPRHMRSPAIIVNNHLMVPFVEILEHVGGRAHLDANGTINIFITR